MKQPITALIQSFLDQICIKQATLQHEEQFFSIVEIVTDKQ